jgi:hypothetical protein
MKSGDTFLMPAPGISNRTPHLWIVLTDPSEGSQLVAIVSITTLRRGAEQTMILRKGEHPFIDRDSSVCYADARIVDARDLDAKATAGQIRMHAACSAKTLENVRAGILASELVPQKVERFYESTIKQSK